MGKKSKIFLTPKPQILNNLNKKKMKRPSTRSDQVKDQVNPLPHQPRLRSRHNNSFKRKFRKQSKEMTRTSLVLYIRYSHYEGYSRNVHMYKFLEETDQLLCFEEDDDREEICFSLFLKLKSKQRKR